MNSGDLKRPSTAELVAVIRKRISGSGGATDVPARYRFPVYRTTTKPRRPITGGALSDAEARKVLTEMLRNRHKQLGKGVITNIVRTVLPYLRRIPALFRSSKTVRGIAKAMGSTAAATGVQILSDKLQKPKTPLKTVAMQRGTEGGIELLDKAKRALEKKQEGSGRKSIKGLAVKKQQKKKKTIRQSKIIDIFDA